LSPLDVFSLNHGAARRIYYLGDGLACYGNKVTIICVLGREERHRRVGKTENNAKMIGIPFTQLILLFPIVLKYLVHADIVQLEFPFLSPLIPFFKILRKPIILDEHGVEVYIKRELNQILERRLSKVEYIIILLLEWLAVKASSVVFTCSDYDAKKLIEKYRVASNKLVTIPNGVNCDFLEYTNPNRYDKPSIVFLGNFDNAANVYAAKVILNEIIPFLRDKNFIFVFVGRNPPQWLVKNKIKNCVKVYGNVRDVRPYLAGADVAIAPIYHGSGTRIKILEYMALSKPIVSTSKGAEGLDVEDGKHMLLRNTPEEFAEAIIDLLSNKKLATQIGKNGQKLAMEKYLWKNIVRKVIKVYEDLLN